MSCLSQTLPPATVAERMNRVSKIISPGLLAESTGSLALFTVKANNIIAQLKRFKSNELKVTFPVKNFMDFSYAL